MFTILRCAQSVGTRIPCPYGQIRDPNDEQCYGMYLMIVWG